jgi:Ohr subfamily peroxiredoxin
MTPLYTAAATATGGREGRVASADGTLDFPVSMPKALGGAGHAGTNPEQLFAAGYAACFASALGLVARMRKVDIGAPRVTADVTIGRDEGGYGLSVALTAHLPGVPREQALALVEAAHQVCPYSKATRNNIPVTLSVAD